MFFFTLDMTRLWKRKHFMVVVTLKLARTNPIGISGLEQGRFLQDRVPQAQTRR